MADVHDKETRSYNMSMIKGKSHLDSIPVSLIKPFFASLLLSAFLFLTVNGYGQSNLVVSISPHSVLSDQEEVPIRIIVKKPGLVTWRDSTFPGWVTIDTKNLPHASGEVMFTALDGDSVMVVIIMEMYMEYWKGESVAVVQLRSDTTNHVSFVFPKPCPNVTATNKCPVCKDGTGVIPISYGLIRGTGQKGGRRPYIDYYPGGCMIPDCPPKYFCNRDKLKF